MGEIVITTLYLFSMHYTGKRMQAAKLVKLWRLKFKLLLIYENVDEDGVVIYID